jgi:3-phytase
LRTVGGRGRGQREFLRPNGVAVADDLLFVVERDNRRVQVLHLPSLEHVMYFGTAELVKPYGIALLRRSPHVLEVFITDDYRGFLGRTPADRRLGARIKHFRISTGTRAAHLVQAFGAVTGAGRLRQVESIAVDPDNGLLLIADEEALDIKIYDADGRFTGRTIGGDVLKHEPEGIVLYACPEGAGYWIVADQHRRDNRFLVFDRSSLTLRGAFTGHQVTNTDGVALVQSSVGAMSAGAFYAVHDDSAVGAFSWTAIATALGLRADCSSEADAGLQIDAVGLAARIGRTDHEAQRIEPQAAAEARVPAARTRAVVPDPAGIHQREYARLPAHEHIE